MAVMDTANLRNREINLRNIYLLGLLITNFINGKSNRNKKFHKLLLKCCNKVTF